MQIHFVTEAPRPFAVADRQHGSFSNFKISTLAQISLEAAISRYKSIVAGELALQSEFWNMTNSTDLKGRAAGLAALAICESLLLALSDLQVIGDREARGVLEDAAAAHRNGNASAQDPELNYAIVTILDHIIAGRTSIPPR